MSFFSCDQRSKSTLLKIAQVYIFCFPSFFKRHTIFSAKKDPIKKFEGKKIRCSSNSNLIFGTSQKKTIKTATTIDHLQQPHKKDTCYHWNSYLFPSILSSLWAEFSCKAISAFCVKLEKILINFRFPLKDFVGEKPVFYFYAVSQ